MRKRIKKFIKVGALSLLAVLIAGLFIAQSCSSAQYSSGDKRMKKIEKSEQYREGKFHNYNGPMKMNFLTNLPLLWEFLFADNNRMPDVKIPVHHNDLSTVKAKNSDELSVTWAGHSSQIINIDGKLILTDPVYYNSTVFMGPSRYNGDIPFDINALPEIDLVLISHNHYDHLNIKTIKSIHKKVKHFIVPLMVGAELEAAGIPAEKITEMDWWDEITLFDDFLIAFAPTQHFSGRGLFDRDETLWGSFVVKGPLHSVYFSGDSGYFDGFAKIGEKYGPFDLTMMECGAYNQRWHHIHMMPEETVQAHIDVKGKILQPMHWGTFNLALHPWYDPMVRVAKAADSLGVKLATPVAGQTITIEDSLKTERWWEPLITVEKLP